METALGTGLAVVFNFLHMLTDIKVQQGSAHIFAVLLHWVNFDKVGHQGMVRIEIIQLEAWNSEYLQTFSVKVVRGKWRVRRRGWWMIN